MQMNMKNLFIGMSNNKLMQVLAQKWGYRIVAGQFIAGTNVEGALQTVRFLNERGFTCTVDHLGEFVTEEDLSLRAKNNIIHFMHQAHKQELDCHVSLKLTQLGLDISEDFCLHLMKEIMKIAKQYDIFVNIDTEDRDHYDATVRILKELLLEYDNIGTVIQSYYYDAEDLMDEFKDVRLRIVKGAYKEGSDVAYQDKDRVDKQFLRLAKKRLSGKVFTSIATHDHEIIDALLHYIVEEKIDSSLFEFQMLFGFREELQQKLKDDGYNFCIYLPYGEDWFGYFMRRLVERPKNMELLIKNKLYENGKLKKKPFIYAGIFIATLYTIYTQWKKK